MKEITPLLVLILVLSIILISGCISSDDTTTQSSNYKNTTAQTPSTNTSNTVKAADYPTCPLCGAVCNKDLDSGIKANNETGMCPNCDIVVDAPLDVPGSSVVCEKCKSTYLQTFNKWNEPTQYKCMDCGNIGWLDDIEN